MISFHEKHKAFDIFRETEIRSSDLPAALSRRHFCLKSFSSSFSFSNLLIMSYLHYDIHYPSLKKTQENVHKSCEIVSFCFRTDQKDEAKKNVYEVDQNLMGWELSLSTCPRVWNRPPRKRKNCKSPGVCQGEHSYR